MPVILDGKVVSNAIRNQLRSEISAIPGRKPKLATLLIGNDESAIVYIRNKEKACHEVGIESEQINFPDTISEKELCQEIQKINQNPLVDGILLQMPLPKTINPDKVVNSIAPDKDVDCLHPINLGLLCAGNGIFIPNTPQSVMSILVHYQIPIQGKRVVVIGRSNIVGKPVALLLLQNHATVTICHSKTIDLPAVSREADILVVAIGKPGMIDQSYIKPGAVVCDVGIHYIDGKIVGDVQFESASKQAAYITPVPGGVGSVTTSLLLQNTLKAFHLHR